MAIKKYGLDEAEIEHLRAANCTDEEINDLNRRRVKEQLDEDNPTGGVKPESDEPEEITDPQEFEFLTKEAIGSGYLGIDKFGEPTNDPMKLDSAGPGVRAALDALDA